MKINKKKIIIGMLFLIVLTSLISATYIRSNPQFSQYQSSGFGYQSSLEFDKSMCSAGQDFVLQIAPFGCTPAVVRSDLLEEQDVPVFCKLAATKINPLINVEAIDSISFSGSYPKEIAGIGFHPASAALGVSGKLNSPILENIGYVVIVLKKQENASQMPDYVQGNLSARIRYNIDNAFGIGKRNFYLPVLTDEQWKDRKNWYGFWNSKGYIRAEDVSADSARISIYDDSGKRVSSVDLKRGETSNKILLPGFQCLASLRLRLDKLENLNKRVLLRVGDDNLELSERESFLNGKCRVNNIDKKGVFEKVDIHCREDAEAGKFTSSSKGFTLSILPKANFTVGDKIEELSIGDKIKDNTYLGYFGYVQGSKEVKALLVTLKDDKKPKPDKLSDDDLKYLAQQVRVYSWGKEKTTNDFADLVKKLAEKASWLENYFRKIDTKFVSPGESYDGITFNGFTGPKNAKLDSETQKNYEKAKEDYE
ncbi:hypothetical protein DRN73_08365, partial [Candidatus Pacearchaeota archaeon]